MSSWLALSPFLGSTFFCVGFIPEGSLHKAERWPLALSLHPLLSGSPMKRGFLLPSGSKKTQGWISGEHLLSHGHPCSNSQDRCDRLCWLNSLGPSVYPCTQPHPNHLYQQWRGGVPQRQIRVLLPAERNGFRAGTDNRCPLHPLIFYRTHFRRCCSIAFATTSPKFLKSPSQK